MLICDWLSEWFSFTCALSPAPLSQGTVSQVVSEGAGLYVIDRQVGLCLAYQPSPRRRLRAGDGVEVSQRTGGLRAAL